MSTSLVKLAVFFNVIFPFLETKDKLVMAKILQNKTISWHHLAWFEVCL